MEHIISCHYSPDKGDGKVSAALATISYNITDAFTSAYNGYTSDTSGLQLISAKKTVVCHKTGLWLKHLTWLLECSRCSTSNQCSRDWLQLRSSYSYIGAPSSAQLSSDLRVAGVTPTGGRSHRRSSSRAISAAVSGTSLKAWPVLLHSLTLAHNLDNHFKSIFHPFSWCLAAPML